MSKNFLENGDSIKEITLCLTLNTVDLSHNDIDGDDIIVTLSAAPALVSINIVGNPVMNTPQFRKKAISRMPRLAYMDRPVFEAERLAAEAWATGGREAELMAREKWRIDQQNKAKEERRVFREWKAAKVEERRKQIADAQATASKGNGGEGTVEGDGDSDMTSANGGTASQSSTGTGTVPNVTKLAHKFWSAEATRSQAVEPKPNAFGKYDVASFRVPSYTPDPISYDDCEAKEYADEPPPLSDEVNDTETPKNFDSLSIEDSGVQVAPPPAPTRAFKEKSQSPTEPQVAEKVVFPMPPIKDSSSCPSDAYVDNEEALRRQRVKDSLARYRSDRKAKVETPSVVPSDSSTSASSPAGVSITSTSKSQTWTEEMDKQLATLKRSDSSATSEICAQVLNELICSDGTQITADEVTQRWAELTFGDDIDSDVSTMNFAISKVDNEAPAISKYLTKPVKLPSTIDYVDVNHIDVESESIPYEKQVSATLNNSEDMKTPSSTDFDELD